MIYTGGTIGMIENPETGVLESFNFEHLQENMPELKKLGYSVSTIQFDPPMDSSEMGPDSWMKIVKIIAEKTGLPLVMHGGSGVSEEDYRTAIRNGICKINYYSYMSKAAVNAAQHMLAAQDVTFWHDLALTAQEAMQADAERAMGVFAGL